MKNFVMLSLIILLSACSSVDPDKMSRQMNNILSSIDSLEEAEQQLETLLRRDAVAFYDVSRACIANILLSSDDCDVEVSDGYISYSATRRVGSQPGSWIKNSRPQRTGMSIFRPGLRAVYMPPMLGSKLLGGNHYLVGPNSDEPQMMRDEVIQFQSENSAIRALALMNAIDQLD